MRLAQGVQKDCSDKPFAHAYVMEDAREQKKRSSKDDLLNQETRHGQRPARMVGLFSLEFALSGMEANRDARKVFIWQRSRG